MNTNTIQKTSIPRINKIFSVYVALLPVLQYYRSPVSGFNLATLLALIFFPVFIFLSKGKVLYHKNYLVITVYTLFITFNVIFTTMLYEHPINMEYDGAYLRMILLFVSILYLGQNYFNIDYALKALEIMLLASAAFMVVQFGSYFILGYFITGNIKFLVTLDAYVSISRATGFYMEPAQYAQAATLYLTFMLFSKDRIKKHINIMIVIAGVVMTGSGQGYLYLALIGIFYMLEHNKTLNRRKLLYGVIILGAFLTFVIIAIQIPYVQNAIARVLPSENGIIGGSALAGRTYTNKYYYMLSSVEQRWGVGFGLAQNAIPSSALAYINTLYLNLIECGYISVAVWVFVLLYLFLNGSLEVKIFILIYTVMLYFTGMGRPMMICYFFSFLLAQSRKNEAAVSSLPVRSL